MARVSMEYELQGLYKALIDVDNELYELRGEQFTAYAYHCLSEKLLALRCKVGDMQIAQGFEPDPEKWHKDNLC